MMLYTCSILAECTFIFCRDIWWPWRKTSPPWPRWNWTKSTQ